MITVFIDTSVLLSACLSKTGASAFILGFCRKKKVKGLISKYVLSELKRNAEKLDQAGKRRLNYYILQSNLNIVENPINPPILAAAIKYKTEYLVTHNTKDFLLPKVKNFAKPMTILTPRDFVMLIK